MKNFLFLAALSLCALTFTSCGSKAENKGVQELDDAGYTALMDMIEAGEQKRPIVIDFTASWCPPCQVFAPIYKATAEKMGEQIDFYKVDIDKCPNAAIRAEIESIPTLIYRAVGEDSYDQLPDAPSSAADFEKQLKTRLKL